MAEWSGPQHCSLSQPGDLGETVNNSLSEACLSVNASDATYFRVILGANRMYTKGVVLTGTQLLLLILLF